MLILECAYNGCWSIRKATMMHLGSGDNSETMGIRQPNNPNPRKFVNTKLTWGLVLDALARGECGGSVVECRTPEREVRGSKPTAAVLCP